MFITNGRFTNSARVAAREGSPITLIDGNDLVKLVIKYELYITPVKTYVLDEFYNTEEQSHVGAFVFLIRHLRLCGIDLFKATQFKPCTALYGTHFVLIIINIFYRYIAERAAHKSRARLRFPNSYWGQIALLLTIFLLLSCLFLRRLLFYPPAAVLPYFLPAK